MLLGASKSTGGRSDREPIPCPCTRLAARKRNLDAEHYKPTLVNLPLADFTFTTVTGEKIPSSLLRGKNTVLDIRSTWCGACVSELGGFAKFHQIHPEVKLLLVARDSAIPDIRKVFRSQGISEQIIVATHGYVEKFGDNGVPQTYVVDENGHIRILHYGALPDVVWFSVKWRRGVLR
ncbi:MAG: TlpA disulfide reductase family protein [Candidatus Sulfotelmatobacter sp.]|jgi:thiol-disulfide isomerase/thioredoxin